jgi:hypothetical protein
MPFLCPTRRVIAFDTAGFGSTAPLPRGILPTIPNLVEYLDRSISGIGIRVPVDIAGNSLGGSMALEAARRGIARSVVAISPAGLWACERPAASRAVRVPRFAIHGDALPRPREGDDAGAPLAGIGTRSAYLNGKLAHARGRRATCRGRPREIDGIRRDIRAHAPSVLRTRHHRSSHGGVWRPRLDPAEGFTVSGRPSGAHQVDRKARLGSCTDVGRSSRRLATHPGGTR